jgi:hypothetical protein
MLTGGRCDKSGRRKAQRELEYTSSLLSESRRRSKNCFGGSAEGVRVGVIAVTVTILIAVTVCVAFDAVTTAAAAAVSFAASYSL